MMSQTLVVYLKTIIHQYQSQMRAIKAVQSGEQVVQVGWRYFKILPSNPAYFFFVQNTIHVGWLVRSGIGIDQRC